MCLGHRARRASHHGCVVSLPVDAHLEGKFWLCVAYSRFFVYAILAIGTAVFTTWIVTRRYRGSQPAAFENVQTVADLVDVWSTDDKGRCWWGDKIPREEDSKVARHAGTAS